MAWKTRSCSTFEVLKICPKSEKVSKIPTFGSILPWGGSQNALFRKMTSQTPPKPLVSLVLAPRGRKGAKRALSGPGNILAQPQGHFGSILRKMRPRRKGEKCLPTFPHRCSEKVEDGLPKSPQNVTFRQLSCLAARKLCTNRRDGVLLRPICVAFVHGSPPGRAEKRKSIFSDFQSY